MKHLLETCSCSKIQLQSFRSLLMARTTDTGGKIANRELLYSCLVYSTILGKFFWTFGNYRKTQGSVLAIGVAWFNTNPRQMGKSRYAINVQWQGAMEEEKHLEKSPGYFCSGFVFILKKGGHPLYIRDKYVIRISAWFFYMLWNILKFNLWEMPL